MTWNVFSIEDHLIGVNDGILPISLCDAKAVQFVDDERCPANLKIGLSNGFAASMKDPSNVWSM